MRRMIMAVLFLSFAASTAFAAAVTVEFIGEVEYNQINNGVFSAVGSGNAVHATFKVDSENFIDSTNYGVRAYPIEVGSFALTIGSVGPVGLANPQPDGATSYFCVRNADPVADGFFIANDTEWDYVLPAVDVPAQLDPFFTMHWSVGYEGTTLASRDIADAVGSYGYTGLTNFYTALSDAWADPMGLVYVQINISMDAVANDDMSFGEVKNLFR